MTLQVALRCTGSYAVPTLPVNIFRVILEPAQCNGREGEGYAPGDEISGKLFMSNYESFRCYGIYVALEGKADVSYESGDTTRARDECILPNTWRIYLFGKKAEAGSQLLRQSFLVSGDDYEYSFTIPIKKIPFPGTFSGPYGQIYYRIAAVIETSNPASMKIAYKHIKIQSYFNLRTVPTTLRRGIVEGQQYKSIFSKKTGLKFSLTLPRTGFLSEEEIPFSLTLMNPYQKTVNRVFVGLTKKVCYISHVTSKSSKTVVAFRENTDPTLLFSVDTALWSDSITIPKDTYPSVSGQIIQHIYTVKVEIYVRGSVYATLQGDVPITIGTVREIESSSLLSPTDAPVCRSRSASVMSITSGCGSIYSLPPAYSQLSSRAPSLSSIETLPPFYEDALALGRRRKSTICTSRVPFGLSKS